MDVPAWKRIAHLSGASAARGLYRLSLIPHAAKGLSAVEPFGHLVSALHRHAAIARELRQQGWIVVSYGTTPKTPTFRSAFDAAAA